MPDPATTATASELRRPTPGRRLRWLVLVSGSGWGEHRPQGWLLEGGDSVLGREPGECGLRIDEASVSRRHASLHHEPGLDAVQVRDLGSKNGTWVNGRRVDSEHLASGSVLRLGDAVLAYSELVVPSGLPAPQPAPGTSLARTWVEALADRAAPSDLPVLILGPTGAGKELLARRIHDHSGRPGPLVAVNCATFSRELLGSELFGHVRGAFSGAVGNRRGLFGQADRGTVFLDEVAELPGDQQAALLRAVQECRIRPVGADREHAVDVRIVAATHQDLERRQREGAFREDLLSRLSAVSLRLPGLAERREEILPLFRGFLGHPAPPLTTAAAEALLLYQWPRNVRELQQAAHGARLFATEVREIDLPVLPTTVQRGASMTPAPPQTSSGSARPTRAELEALLDEHEGNVAAVARSLGQHRGQVYRWLEKYGLQPRRHRPARE